jgi:glycerate 2-kinase
MPVLMAKPRSTLTIANSIFESALQAVNPYNIIQNTLKLRNDTLCVTGINRETVELNLRDFKKIYLVGAGKASAAMAKALIRLLGDRITSGHVVSGETEKFSIKQVTHTKGSHPLPDQNSLRGTGRIIDICSKAQEQDLVIFMLSGGASSFLCFPAEFMSLSKLRSSFNKLVRSGAPIEEVNAVRRGISKVKGGRLAEFVYPAKCVNLIISDVIGDRIETIGSGPLVRNVSKENAINIIERYAISTLCDRETREYMQESLQPIDNKYFKNINNIILGNLDSALKAAAKAANHSECESVLVSNHLSGEAKDQGKILAALCNSIQLKRNGPVALISGGETTVRVTGKGKGGRNQELALAFAQNIDTEIDFALISAGTDGIDGNSTAAGAVIDKRTAMAVQADAAIASRALKQNDTNSFLKKMNATIETGPTGSNVGDVQIVVLSRDFA